MAPRKKENLGNPQITSVIPTTKSTCAHAWSDVLALLMQDMKKRTQQAPFVELLHMPMPTELTLDTGHLSHVRKKHCECDQQFVFWRTKQKINGNFAYQNVLCRYSCSLGRNKRMEWALKSFTAKGTFSSVTKAAEKYGRTIGGNHSHLLRAFQVRRIHSCRFERGRGDFSHLAKCLLGRTDYWPLATTAQNLLCLSRRFIFMSSIYIYICLCQKAPKCWWGTLLFRVRKRKPPFCM